MSRSFDATRPLILGALYSSTGATAFVERTQFNATMLAIDEVNAGGGVAGREVVAVTCDAASSPERYRASAEHMLDNEGASLLLGCYMTNTRQAVVPVVERRGATLAYAAPYEGFEYSPNVIYGGAVPNQHILLLARHLFRNGGKSFYLVGTRYTFPVESNRVLMTLITEQNGVTLAERYVPLMASRRELDQLVQDIQRKKPDVVFCTIVGAAAAIFYELCAAAGLTANTVIASLTITEAELATMPPGVAVGHLTSATYFQSLDTPENHAFVAAYQARYGANEQLNAMAETAYSLTHMVLAAVGEARSVAPRDIRDAMSGRSFSAPQGVIRLDRENSHFYLWPRIGQVLADGQFRVVAQSRQAVKPDPYLIHHSLDDWDAPPDAAPIRAAGG